MCEIVLSNVCFKYEGSSAEVLRGLDLSISEGELVVITGPTGSGKTTLCRIITGLIPKLYRGELRGHVRVCGIDLTRSSLGRLRKRILYVPQNPEEYLLNITVRDEVTSYLGEAISIEDINSLIKYALSMVGLEGKEDEVIFKLSDGEKQRLSLAPAFIREYKVVIIDEALSFIDTAYLSRIMDSLIKLKLEAGSTLIIIEKNPYILKKLLKYSPRLIILEKGVKVFDEVIDDLLIIKESICTHSRYACKILHYVGNV